jgi:hypothetical protein
MLPAPVLLMLEREAAELAALHLGLPRVTVPLTVGRNPPIFCREKCFPCLPDVFAQHVQVDRQLIVEVVDAHIVLGEIGLEQLLPLIEQQVQGRVRSQIPRLPLHCHFDRYPGI